MPRLVGEQTLWLTDLCDIIAWYLTLDVPVTFIGESFGLHETKVREYLRRYQVPKRYAKYERTGRYVRTRSAAGRTRKDARFIQTKRNNFAEAEANHPG